MHRSTLISTTLILISGIITVAVWRLLVTHGHEKPVPVISPIEREFLQAGQTAESVERYAEAEEIYVEMLEIFPDSKVAHQRLAGLKFADYRIHQARQHAQFSLEEDHLSYAVLLIASGFDQFSLDEKSIRQRMAKHPLSNVQDLLQEKRYDFAIDILKNFVFKHPNHLQAQGWLGQALALVRSAEFTTWNQSLPPDAESHPEIWLARGIAAKQVQDNELALHCFLQTLIINPLHLEAATHLQQIINESMPKGSEETIRSYVETLQHIDTLIDELELAQDPEMMVQLAVHLRKLGKFQLANGWALLASQHAASATSLDQLKRNVKHDPTAIGIEDLLSQLDDMERKKRLNKADWSNFSFHETSQETMADMSSIQFLNVASEVGIDFKFENGSHPGFQLGHLFETTGGGVGVLDYDMDGWSDLYLAQGGDWRESPVSPTLSNKVYRNISGRMAQDVTANTGLESFDYSQGIAIGDYNADGFADIYVCQLRENRLYENQGDGTFHEVSDFSQTSGDDWSLSAAFSDLNNDGLSDLYVVNYLDRDDVESRPCEVRGAARACPPHQFEGSFDQLYLNSGDGRFEEISRSAGIAQHPGKGMGIIIADINNNQSLDIFVGNDGEENFLFQKQSGNNALLPEFEERGVLSGIAFDSSGETQATMGIAAGDLNEDGRIDLVTTNFYKEPVAYYDQNDDGSFVDQIIRTGQLYSQSLESVGFGVQLTDADFDGDLDILIANGHVDRSSVTGEPDVMRSQFFLNSHSTDFRLISPNIAGDYFSRRLLGRAVAKLDWDRDGREDFCITHLDQPVALLLNKTPIENHFVGLNLIAVEKERTAIGAVVTIRCGEKSWTQQVTSGDGYLVTNEKQLVFGIDHYENIDEINVKWNSGSEQTFKNVAPDRKYLCIEKRDQLLPTD